MNNNTIDVVNSILKEAGHTPLDPAQIVHAHSDVRVIKKHVRSWMLGENSMAYIGFEYKGQIYKTVLRGHHQAVNCAYAIEICERLKIARQYIDRGLVNIELNGRFETISKKPFVVFDTVQTAEDMKNFCANVDDYFGRAMQKAQATPQNIHPKPFKRLIICDYFSPELCCIRQGLKIIFTTGKLQKQYFDNCKSIVKTSVMEFEKALPHALQNFPEHKIFIIGGQNLYQKSKRSID